jgi:hypothetical protein
MPSIPTVSSLHTFGIRFNGPYMSSDRETKRGPITLVAIHSIRFITSSGTFSINARIYCEV